MELFDKKHNHTIIKGRIKKQNLFGNHDEFVKKFESKKTTDDCYTPVKVFDIVLQYVSENFDLSNKIVMRPFYPDGDFENTEYPENCVVVDNPPFSIISKIAQFYVKKRIPFFLFAPHLTLFGSDIDCTHIVVGGNITYDNGAVVKTSFLSNMFGNAKVIGDAGLYEKFKKLELSKRTPLPKYQYPDNVLTVSHVSYIVEKGVSLIIDKEHTRHCRALDSQKIYGKGIFGSGFLISDKAAADKAAADKADIYIWELSEKERKIIKSLGGHSAAF